MCRIAGILDPSTDVATLRSLVQQMNDCLAHGGPDDEGIYVQEEDHLVLGNRRLSLLDLSPAGHMPMQACDGRYTITYNGEIYNFLDLKHELALAGYSFHTGTDTEVILAAFNHWRTDAFSKLNGMFGIALWDNVEKTLFLARGPSGIKPLYYSTHDGKLAFASELRALKLLPWLNEENPDWKVYLMAYGHLPEPVTTLKHVRPLPKGSMLIYNARTRKHEIRGYYHYSFHEGMETREQALDTLRINLRTAVRRHLIADAPIGVFLSGGLDSSIIALLAHEEKANINTLSLIFKDKRFSEKKYQDILKVKMPDAKHHQFLLEEDEFHKQLPGILEAMDLPSSDGINTWFISKYARETGLKAVLSGIGGDELFGGYPSFNRMQTVLRLAKLPSFILKASGKFSNKKLHRLPYLTLGGPKGLFLFLRGQSMPSEIAAYLDIKESEVWQILEAEPRLQDISNLSAKNQASWIELNMYMQNQLLRDSDVMSMIHGLEIRVPYLDKDFVSSAVKIRSDIKYAGNFKKQMLVDAFGNLLPREIYDRPKMGFSFPFAEWLGNSSYVKDMLLSGPPATQGIYDNFKKGQIHWSQLLTVLLLEKPDGQQTTKISTPSKTINYIDATNGLNDRLRLQSTLFLTLNVFSATGGIEKMSRIAGKAMDELGEDVLIYSMHDKPKDARGHYFPLTKFRAYAANKIKFVTGSIAEGRKRKVVVMSHINLISVGWLIKLFSQKTKLVLFAHGIEVWKKFSWWKKRMINQCDLILAVSNYTKDTMIELNSFDTKKFKVLNNCLDPFLEKPNLHGKSEGLLKKYGLTQDDKVLMTLTRMSSGERYKGYDKVLLAMNELNIPSLKYLLIGKYDQEEKAWLDKYITELGLDGRVVFTGYVPDEELADHFSIADVYVMPSEKEGFGIVFIEAMYYGKPVIAGNKDGSVDALAGGELGVLVDPTDTKQIASAISSLLHDGRPTPLNGHVLDGKFGYEIYKKRFGEFIHDQLKN